MLLDRAKANTATAGTGTVALGAAVAPYQTWAAAGATDGATISYLLEDGTAWELGRGVYSAGAGTLTRPGPGTDATFASSTGALLALSGAATVACVANVADFVPVSGTAAIVKIAEVIAPGGSNTINFPGLPNTYRNLLIRASVRGDDGGARQDCQMTFNGDTGNNYFRNVMQNNNGAVSAYQDDPRANVPIGFMPCAGATAGDFGTSETTVFDYAQTDRFKNISIRNQTPAGGGNNTEYFVMGAWRETAAVNDVSFVMASGNFAAGSRIALYGEL